MAKKYEFLKLLLWIGIVFFVLWFLVFSVAPASVLSALSITEADSFFVRLYGIFPLGWAVLFLFALKDVEKNIAIINGAIITAALTIISIVVFHFVKSVTMVPLVKRGSSLYLRRASFCIQAEST